jgi:pimeloyl-ACP methyl ester carboxylesterase
MQAQPPRRIIGRRLGADINRHGANKKLTASPTASVADRLKPCKVRASEEELLCGKLSVFENRQAHTGRKIELNVVVLPALNPDRKAEPLFHIAGGPGDASTAAVKYYTKSEREYRRQRDVILVDQRGTGAFNPLGCKPAAGDFFGEIFPFKYVENCRRDLERTADLAQYTTSIATDDLDDVRAWLGYDKINLIGLSYGTRAALVYLRRHPQHVRSAVLIGLVPTNYKMPLHHARSEQRAGASEMRSSLES